MEDETPKASDKSALRTELSRYSFYHAIEVEPGLFTEPVIDFSYIQEPILKIIDKLDLSGKRVLDIGCRDGLFSFAAEKKGAAEIVGIDNDLSKGAVEFLIPHLKSKVQMHQLSVYDIRPEKFGKFDMVCFPGVLYHLRYPIWALKQIRDVMKPGCILLLETAIYLGHTEKPLIFCPIGEESPYEPTSVSFFNYKALVDTLFTLNISTHYVEYLKNESDIARGTFLAQFDPNLIDPALHLYWEGNHSRHSDRSNRAPVGRKVSRKDYAPEEPWN